MVSGVSSLKRRSLIRFLPQVKNSSDASPILIVMAGRDQA
jgi:hypothetical protein